MSDNGFQTFKEITSMEIHFTDLIPNLLPSVGIAFLVGTQKHGKTYLAIDLGLAVASGGEWLGKFKPIRGTVLYLDQEARKGSVPLRIQRLAKGRGISEVDAS